MLKKYLLVFFVSMFSLVVFACDQTEATTTTTLVTTTTQTTTTMELETTTTTTENPCKACGYSYVYEDLDYKLVWFDEFDKESGIPSIIKWKYQVGDGGWGNDELQYYTNGLNSVIENNNLVITARLEDMGDSHYTSSRMNSGRSFLYGKFEVRAKLPQGSGTWPALWLMPDRSSYGAWPKSGEIDMMEHVGTDMDKVHFSIHTEKYYFKINTQKTAVSVIPNVELEYHVYSIEWLPDKIMFFVDDVLKFTYSPTNYVACPGYEEWPFDQPFYLIMNIAIGGWGGTPYAGFVEEKMYIDYVRVYQASNLFA